MISLIALLLALAAFSATIAGVNFVGAEPDAPLNFDILAAGQGLASRLVLETSIVEQAAMPLGAVGLAIPAIILFFIVKGAFGGAR